MAFVPDFRVVAEAPDWIVVDKPAPLQVHPAKPDSPPTLLDGLERLLAYEIANGARLSIINRLDRETSGLVLVAKNRDAARVLGKAMMRRRVEKAYLALVHGWPAQGTFTVEAPLRRRGEFDATTPVYLMQAVHPDGAASRTEVRVRARWTSPDPSGELQRFALVEARPATGRMHQIRVHLSHAGHPVVGDKLYGPGGPDVYLRFIESGWTESLRREVHLPRHALHSCRLAVDTEEWGRLAFDSPLPADLAGWVPVDVERGHAPGGGG
jgi:23S rRNA pseudouridine1911/1915/1917 synthase